MQEDVGGVLHRLELAGGVIDGRRAGDVGDYSELLVEDGEEASAVPVLGPVVGEVRDNVMQAESADLAGVASRQVGLPELHAV